MNDSEFLQAVRAAYAPATATSTLTAKIERGVTGMRRGRTIRRRVGISFAAAGFVAATMVALPTVRAEAAIRHIEQALDGVKLLKLRAYAVDGEGHRYLSETTTFAEGEASVTRGKDERMVFSGGAWYVFDATAKAWVKREANVDPNAYRLSNMFNSIGGSRLTRRADISSATLDGRAVRRISIDNLSLPERYIFFEDPATDLPIRMECEAREMGEWRLCMVTEFDYPRTETGGGIAADLRRYPVLSQSEVDGRFVAEMTKNRLAEVSMEPFPLVVRSFDVAQDGTVFVVFQSGARNPRSWSGFALQLGDDIGTTYLRPEMFVTELAGPVPQGGYLETQAFVPLEPIREKWPRHYTLLTKRFSNGHLARSMQAIRIEPDGRQIKYWTDNGRSTRDHDAQTVEVMSPDVAAPTCLLRPAYMDRLSDMGFSKDSFAAITEDDERAKYCLDQHRWAEAIRWGEDELAQIDAFERDGNGPYGRDAAEKEIAEGHAGLAAHPSP